jgi:hypothetical protein
MIFAINVDYRISAKVRLRTFAKTQQEAGLGIEQPVSKKVFHIMIRIECEIVIGCHWLKCISTCMVPKSR